MNRFLKGTLILFLSGIILKILGFFYQIYVVRTIGTEALGLVNMVFPYYITLVTIATMGMPLAISRLVAKGEARGVNTGKIMRTAFAVVLILSVSLTVLAVIILPEVFVYLEFDTRLRWCFYIMLPGITIVPLCSVMRGYFQGKQKMLAPSAGQIIEQLSRITCGVGLIYCFSGAYQGYLALFLAAAMMMGEFVGATSLGLWYIRERRLEKLPKNDEAVLGEMLSLGVPATLTRLTSSVDLILEAWLLPKGLVRWGYTNSQSATLYGQINSVCFTLISLPGVLTNALATMLIPSIASLSVSNSGRLKEKCANALLVTYMFALPVAAIFYVGGGELLRLIYHLDGLDMIMQILAIGAVFIYLGQTAVGILQGLGENKLVFVTNMGGSFAKIMLIYLLIWQRNGALVGAALAFSGAYFLQCLGNIFLLHHRVGFTLPFNKLFVPLVLSVIVGRLLLPASALLSPIFGAWAIIPAAVILALVYLSLLIVFRIFSFKMLS